MHTDGHTQNVVFNCGGTPLNLNPPASLSQVRLGCFVVRFAWPKFWVSSFESKFWVCKDRIKNSILNYVRYTLTLLIFSLPISRVESAKLILVICCDTLADDIEPALHNDLKNIYVEGARIADNTGLPLEDTILSGMDLNAMEFANLIEGLNVQSDDVLFFYFSGHGYRAPSKGENPWPNLFFSSCGLGVDFSQVIDLLNQKSPRLLISVADCCNNLLPEHHAPPVYPIAIKKKYKDKVARGYKKLFLKTKGTILITSSEAEEFSWCIPNGALYTLSLLDSIKTEVKKAYPSWSALLNRASIGVDSFQHPYYLLDVNYAE